jgi:ABC-type methionine transport system permease subunit
MRSFRAVAVGTVSVLVSANASPQSGPMMTGGMGGVGWMGGYGGFWVPVLVVVVVVLVAWIVMQRRK